MKTISDLIWNPEEDINTMADLVPMTGMDAMCCSGTGGGDWGGGPPTNLIPQLIHASCF